MPLLDDRDVLEPRRGPRSFRFRLRVPPPGYQPGGALPCMPTRPAQDSAAPTARKRVVTDCQASILVTVMPVMPWMSCGRKPSAQA